MGQVRRSSGEDVDHLCRYVGGCDDLGEGDRAQGICSAAITTPALPPVITGAITEIKPSSAIRMAQESRPPVGSGGVGEVGSTPDGAAEHGRQLVCPAMCTSRSIATSTSALAILVEAPVLVDQFDELASSALQHLSAIR